MSSPNPNQQYQYFYPGFAGEPNQQPNPQPDYHHPQAYPAQYGQTPVKYTEPPGSTPAIFIAELPGSAPTVAPPLVTTTPAQQLNEDERLAQKLQQLEVQKAQLRARSNSNLNLRNSFVVAQPDLQNPASLAYQQEQLGRTHSSSLSSNSPYGAHVSPQPSPSLLPEVVGGSHTVPIASTLPEVVVRPPQPAVSPNLSRPLPSAPVDPISLSAYLERHREVPYPPQWILSPVTSTLYSSFEYAPKTDFLDTLEAQIWRTTRFSKTGRSPPPPAFQFKFKSIGGSFLDPRFSWIMSTPAVGKEEAKNAEWSYHLKRDMRTGMRKSEGLVPPSTRPGLRKYESLVQPLRRMEVLTTYVPAVNYDSLRFHGLDGRSYQWVAHAPLSSVIGARYDTLRHALFVSDERSGIKDPLYGHIVADHTYWDGFIDTADVHAGTRCSGCSARPINGLRWKCKSCPDHDVCEPCRISCASITPACKFTLVSLPDETLHIRDPNVDVPMVVASLQVFKDWLMHTLREQRKRDPGRFKANMDAARKGDLGRMRYWKSSDFEGGIGNGEEIHGTVMKAIECMKMLHEPGLASAAATSRTRDGSTGGDGE